MSLSERDMMLAGNLYQYIESHHFGFWHKYVANVNMTYINCSYKFSRINIKCLTKGFTMVYLALKIVELS